MEEYKQDITDIEENDEIKISRYAFNSFRIERSIRDILNWEERKKS